MKIQLLQIGKTKEAAYKAIEQEFEKRLAPFIDLKTITLPTSTFDEENAALKSKLGSLKKDNTLILFDRKGEMMSSEQFADFLREERDFKGGKVVFCIGGAHGFAPDTLDRADKVLSLSKMTFTHQMVRLFVLEQIYRAMMIMNGRNYHY